MRILVWLIELVMLSLQLTTQAVAESPHNGESSGDRQRRYEDSSARKPYDKFRAISADYPGRPFGRGISNAETKEPARESLRLRIVPGGVECPLGESEDGRLYSLGGLPEDMKQLNVGDQVMVSGMFSSRSHCMKGKTIVPLRIEKLLR